jgi:hypothetical protein
MHLTSLSVTWRVTCLAVVSSFLFVGCGDSSSTSGEFRKYDKLTKTGGEANAAINSVTPNAAPVGDDVEGNLKVESVPGDDSAEKKTTDNGTQVAVTDGGPLRASDDGADDPENPSAKTDDVTPAIRINPLTGAPVVQAAVPLAGGVKLLVKSRKFKIEGPGRALRASFDDFDLLKVLNMDPVTPDAPGLLPDWLKRLDGKRVRVRGFMYPSFLETGIERFILARDNQICCFGREPKIYDLVIVTLKKDVTTDYIQGRPFDVVGVFHISPELPEGGLGGLYKIDNAIVVDR